MKLFLSFFLAATLTLQSDETCECFKLNVCRDPYPQLYTSLVTKEKTWTTWGKIHYAKDGIHIVPTKPRN
jgi:hypothetical protein